ncbi:phytanoyl-CoA dioxygenase family protein [Xenophilus sp. Marseille-Q4582]|uniref:phytanoyl-CoA dioxygenase family protein n=1 Tax=Xenophilus sp. Marseille-Q4582 TaxID=2866600 RepID=UPI001CE3F61A|nr:phytanoyl-CoA dioxygenase family protein [Xenophilus sp. Marseille-Q4582]
MSETGPDAVPDAARQLDHEGWALLPACVAPRSVRALIRVTARRTSHDAGSRQWLAQPACAALAERLRARLAAMGLLPAASAAVQCTLFDKRADRNWLVAWHQDLSVPARAAGRAVRLKEGEPFTQAPEEVLRQLLAVRIHLDDCGPLAGALRVVPRSHGAGWLDNAQARLWRLREGEQLCTARAGDVLLMRPLLLHASSRMQAPVRRRVLHFLFAPVPGPVGWCWNRCVPAP